MNLIKFIVNRKILVGLLSVLVILVGSYAVFKLDKELMPAVSFDSAFVEVNAGEMAAVEVEQTITNQLEQQIASIDGVEEVQSTTAIGRSSISVTFERGRGDEVFKELESTVNLLTADMNGVKDATAFQLSTSGNYEFFLDLAGGEVEDMTSFAEEILEPRLEALPEVKDVLLSGNQKHEMLIEFDREKLIKNGIDISHVIGAIQQGNDEATLGELSGETDSPTLRWDTKLESVQDVESIKVPIHTGFIEVKDIADVSIEKQASSSFVWKNGSKDIIFVQIARTADFTQIDLAEAVRAEIKKIDEENLITGFELTEIVSQADYVKESIDGVTSNILIGGGIAVLILLLFLRNVRATLIIGLSIPTSILLTFASMWYFDYSFNILTLIGLGLGIGMMVDSSIVILESIYRKKVQGLQSFDAVIEGVKEVATAVIASMLTTIVVFLPIGLLGGEAGSFMIMLSVVVAITLISSVVVSFTLIPSLAEKFLKVNSKTSVKKEGKISKAYTRLVAWSVKKKRNSLAVITLFFVILVGSTFLVSKIPMIIMPDMFNRFAQLSVVLETGVPLDEKEKIMIEMNEVLSTIKDVESNYIMDDGNHFSLIVNMTKGDEITREQKAINEEILSSLRGLQENYPIRSAHDAMAGGGGYPVQVTISGNDFNVLQQLAQDFKQELESIDGIVQVSTSIDRKSQQQLIELKSEDIEEAGLITPQIKQYIQQAFMQMPIAEMAVENETLPIVVKWKESTTSKSDLLGLKIPTITGEKELRNFIELKTIETPNEISHKEGERYITVSADIKGRDLGAINRDVQKIIEDFQTPVSYDVSTAGDLETQQQLMQEMLLVLGIAIFLVYLVMAVQFNSLSQPIIVMSVIPMTFVGVIGGLFITQRELSVMSGMGVVMLIGIVLNNAILLIDRTNQLRKEGYSVQEALVQAGNDRIRPIFMTTLTTVGGMLPLALATGGSGNYQAPMATVIISGLLFSTLITLLLVPVVYRLFSSVSNIGKKKRKRVSEEVAEEVA
ncbi:efflux RND transporter permease subunit [Bacillus salitolerans]|uniref:Efflux RND transporter permease subunit n=1 Tax=Bacillus salitolerans TaxID=1437434 RepID=A0ABW4LTU9_9BACI